MLCVQCLVTEVVKVVHNIKVHNTIKSDLAKVTQDFLAKKY